MPKTIVLGLAVTVLAVAPATAQSADRSLCEVGSSIVELLHFEFALDFHPSAPRPADPADLRSSIVFLAECPSQVRHAFRGFSEDSALVRAWIDAVRQAARDTQDADARPLLAQARTSVAHLGDRSLDEFLDGMFADLPAHGGAEGPSLAAVFERQASATLRRYGRCDGAGCLDASDNVLFLLGTHPIAVLQAMRSDSVNAAGWLRNVADESFAGPPERGERAEGARIAVLQRLSNVQARGLEREQRACVHTLSAIKYRAVD